MVYHLPNITILNFEHKPKVSQMPNHWSRPIDMELSELLVHDS